MFDCLKRIVVKLYYIRLVQSCCSTPAVRGEFAATAISCSMEIRCIGLYIQRFIAYNGLSTLNDTLRTMVTSLVTLSSILRHLELLIGACHQYLVVSKGNFLYQCCCCLIFSIYFRGLNTERTGLPSGCVPGVFK